MCREDITGVGAHDSEAWSVVNSSAVAQDCERPQRSIMDGVAELCASDLSSPGRPNVG